MINASGRGHSVNLQSSNISDGKGPLRFILYIRSVGPVDYFQSPLEDEDSHRLRFRCRYLVHVSGFWWASVKTEVKVRHSPIHPNVKYKWGKNMALNTYCQYIYKIIVLGKGSEKKPGKIVPFWQTPSDSPPPGLPFFPRKKLTHYFFGKMNHWCVKLILHLVPFKNLFICFCYISFICPK